MVCSQPGPPEMSLGLGCCGASWHQPASSYRRPQIDRGGAKQNEMNLWRPLKSTWEKREKRERKQREKRETRKRKEKEKREKRERKKREKREKRERKEREKREKREIKGKNEICSSRLWSGSAHYDLEQLRSGSAHWDLEFAVGGRRQKKEEKEVTLIKSRGPHLAGGK